MTRAVVFCSALGLLAWYGVFLAVSPSSANPPHINFHRLHSRPGRKP